MHVDSSFSYLRFAEAVSFDIKKLRRSCTPIVIGTIVLTFRFKIDTVVMIV